MRNLTVAEELIKEHAPEPLAGHTVVVLERLAGGGERLHSVLAPGAEAPKRRAGKPGSTCCLERPPRRVAFAVDASPERRLAFTERACLEDGAREIGLTVQLRYRAVDPKALVARRGCDPLERVREKAAALVSGGFSELPWGWVCGDFDGAASGLVERALPAVNELAAGFGIRVLEIIVTRRGWKHALERAVGHRGTRSPQWLGGATEFAVSAEALPRPDEWLGQRSGPPPPGEILGARQEAFERELAHAALAGGCGSAGNPQGETELRGDLVDCTVFSPPRVQLGGSALVQVFVHLPLEEAEARKLAQEFDAGTARRGFTSLETRLEEGARLTFHLGMGPLEVEEPLAHLTWRGRTVSVQFSVNVPAECPRGPVNGKVTVYRGVEPIGHIRFTLEVCDATRDEGAALTGSAHRYRKAFVSYASADRPEVLRRTQMLKVLDIPFFQDVLSLEPGQRWERELYRNIDDCDVFLLFWSHAARRSKWVLEEVRYAVSRKGGDDDAPPHILPVVIGPSPAAKPPEDLAHIHFDDVLCHVMSAA